MHSQLTGLDWWGCILAAFVPSVLIALIALPIGSRIKAEHDDSAMRGRMIALVSAAFAFIVAFTTNTLWTQDLAIAESARTVGQATSEILQVSREVGPDFEAQVREQLKEFDRASESRDLDAGLTEGSTGAKASVNQLSKLLTDSSKSDAETTEAFDTFHAEYRQYLLNLNSPSVPNLILLVIVTLGMLLAGALASSPRTGTWMSARTFVALSVFVVGLYQFPLWVMNSRKLVLDAVHPYLSPLDAAEAPSNSAFITVFFLLVLALAVITVVLVLPGLFRRKPDSESEFRFNGVEDTTPDESRMQELVQQEIIEDAPPAEAEQGSAADRDDS